MASMLAFSNKSLKLFTLKNRFLVRAKALYSTRTCLTMQGVWLVKNYGYCSCLSIKEWVSIVRSTHNRDLVTYSDLFSSWFSESRFPFFQSGLDLEKFIVDVIIPGLLPFCVNEFIYIEFQVSVWNLKFVGGQIFGRFGCRVCSFIFSHFDVAWYPVYKDFFTIWHWV